MNIILYSHMVYISVYRLNTTEAVLSDVINVIDYNKHFIHSVKDLDGQIGIYLKKIYKYYSEHANLLLNKLEHNIEEALDQAVLTLLDLFKILNLYTDEPVNDTQSSEPRSVKQYYNSKIFAVE